MKKTEHIDHKQWEMYARRIEGKYLRKYGKSLSFSSIPIGARHHIIEYQIDTDIMLVTEGWKQSMLAYAHKHLGLNNPVPLTLAQI